MARNPTSRTTSVPQWEEGSTHCQTMYLDCRQPHWINCGITGMKARPGHLPSKGRQLSAGHPNILISLHTAWEEFGDNPGPCQAGTKVWIIKLEVYCPKRPVTSHIMWRCQPGPLIVRIMADGQQSCHSYEFASPHLPRGWLHHRKQDMSI